MANHIINIRINDLPTLTDEALDQRLSEAVTALGTIGAPILKDGILMLLLEKQSRSTRALAKSSGRLEWATWILVGLTIALAAMTAVLICRAA